MSASPPPATRRPVGRVVVAVVFALLALNAWSQVALIPFGRSADPPLLFVLQAIVGALGAAAAWGSWQGARWSPVAAALYGVVTGGMVASLGPILDLPPEARGGLWTGGVVVLLFSLGLAWYLRRVTTRGAASPPVSHSGDPDPEDHR